eukprot:scaffold11865_cov103-Isochrysis_galbana.AAC.5
MDSGCWGNNAASYAAKAASLPLLLAIVLCIGIGKKPFLAFLATGQHGAAELRVGPDGRLSGCFTVAVKTTPRARGGVTMAPLQLRLEPTEVVLATDKGAARARVDSTNESSPQI